MPIIALTLPPRTPSTSTIAGLVPLIEQSTPVSSPAPIGTPGVIGNIPISANITRLVNEGFGRTTQTVPVVPTTVPTSAENDTAWYYQPPSDVIENTGAG